MLLVVIAGCVVFATIIFVRHFATKSRLVEEEIEKVVARKLSTSNYVTELNRLREDNLVMRNLLIDLVEGETSFAALMTTASPSDNLRYRKIRLQAYRETLAEATYLLRNNRSAEWLPQHEITEARD